MDYIMIPSSLEGFSNAETEIVSEESGESKYIIRGDLEEKTGERQQTPAEVREDA